ncbi:uncharacterized protein FA14DRAFT_162621 [Meira miltonrushii]|uniref:Ubiquitin-like domain-containing protein n=1 Tax=Meira miltonrushii TaxID=1280837 RepID=A0A316V894_9BASI|nr:uncharacterized protein FA14DRAFT_162621 [Meira miltonrushii]PWN31695.1 hypothetical protein FA14DRAFT_162621 [Meira miltonrushii]
MSATQSRPKVRPRPRVRASQEPGSEDGRDGRESTQSARSKSPSVSVTASPSKKKSSAAFQRTSSNTTATAHDDGSEDEDDFYFNTSKTAKLHMPAASSFDDEEEDELTDNSQGTPQDKKRAKDHKAAYRAEWTKKAPKRRFGNLDSDMDSDDENAMSDSTAEGGIGIGRSSREPSQLTTKRRVRQRSASQEVTPPPEISPEKLKMLRVTVSTFIKQNGGAQEDINDDSAMDELFNNEDFNKSIHPDLLKAYRGKGGAQLRQKMRETRPATSQTQKPLPLPPQVKKAVSSTQNAAIELSDSDDNVPSTSTKRILRSDTQEDRDSSPIEVMEVRRATSTAVPKAAVTNQDQRDIKSSLISTPAYTAERPQDSAIAMAVPTPAEESAPEPEEERITVILKAEGGLQESVMVKQTTLVGTLLNHFINTHRDKIPHDRISKVRIRLDGDILQDKQTMQNLDVDDDDQLDVVW